MERKRKFSIPTWLPDAIERAVKDRTVIVTRLNIVFLTSVSGNFIVGYTPLDPTMRGKRAAWCSILEWDAARAIMSRILGLLLSVEFLSLPRSSREDFLDVPELQRLRGPIIYEVASA